MALTKKEIKHYKPLIMKKLKEMGVKDEIGYTQTGTSRMAPQIVKTEDGKFKVENKKVPNYRASNLHSSLTKKLLNLTPAGVERFLSTVLPKTESSDEVLIKTGDSNG